MSLIPPLRVTQLQMELRGNQRREQALIVALAVFEQQQVIQGLRIEPPTFHQMVERVTLRISKHQVCQPGLPAGLRLAIILRILTNGEFYNNLAFSLRVSHTIISLLVPEVYLYQVFLDAISINNTLIVHQCTHNYMTIAQLAFQLLAISTRPSYRHRAIYMRSWR